jgi:hypothetical protein
MAANTAVRHVPMLLPSIIAPAAHAWPGPGPVRSIRGRWQILGRPRSVDRSATAAAHPRVPALYDAWSHNQHRRIRYGVAGSVAEAE